MARACAAWLGVALLFGIVEVVPASGASGGSIAAASSSCQAPWPEAFLIHGRVHACGNDLVDAAGHRVRFLSYEVLNMYAGQGDVTPECGHWSPPPADLAGEVREWGMNSVQILISWSNLEPTPPTRWPGGTVHHHWNTEYLAALDAAIAGFRQHGVAVVLSLGQSRWSQAFRNIEMPDGSVQACGLGMPKWLYPRGGGIEEMVRAERRFFARTDRVQDRFRYVWEMLIRRYRQEPALAGVEILFEAHDLVAQPYLGVRDDPGAVDLAGFYERTGRAIHRIAPGLLVLYSDWQSRNTDPIYFAITRKPQIWNAAYSYEIYALSWDQDIRDRLERYRQRAVAWNVPGWICEFDAFQYGRRTDPRLPGDPHWRRHTRALLARAKADHIGWSFVGHMDYRLVQVLSRGH